MTKWTPWAERLAFPANRAASLESFGGRCCSSGDRSAVPPEEQVVGRQNGCRGNGHREAGTQGHVGAPPGVLDERCTGLEAIGVSRDGVVTTGLSLHVEEAQLGHVKT